MMICVVWTWQLSWRIMTPFSSMPGWFLQIFGHKVFRKKPLYISAFIVVPCTMRQHPDNRTLSQSSASLCFAANELSVDIILHSLPTHSVGISFLVQNPVSCSYPSRWSAGGIIRFHLHSVSTVLARCAFVLLSSLCSGNAVPATLIFYISVVCLLKYDTSLFLVFHSLLPSLLLSFFCPRRAVWRWLLCLSCHRGLPLVI